MTHAAGGEPTFSFTSEGCWWVFLQSHLRAARPAKHAMQPAQPTAFGSTLLHGLYFMAIQDLCEAVSDDPGVRVLYLNEGQFVPCSQTEGT